jgi:hypothetical protein
MLTGVILSNVLGVLLTGSTRQGNCLLGFNSLQHSAPATSSSGEPDDYHPVSLLITRY